MGQFFSSRACVFCDQILFRNARKFFLIAIVFIYNIRLLKRLRFSRNFLLCATLHKKGDFSLKFLIAMPKLYAKNYEKLKYQFQALHYILIILIT